MVQDEKNGRRKEKGVMMAVLAVVVVMRVKDEKKESGKRK